MLRAACVLRLQQGTGVPRSFFNPRLPPTAPLPARPPPPHPTAVDPLFHAFCEGAERNPDDDASDSEGEGEGGSGFFYDEDAALAGAAAAALGVGDVEELLGADPGRFADPDDGDAFEEFEGQAAPPGGSGANGTS